MINNGDKISEAHGISADGVISNRTFGAWAKAGLLLKADLRQLACCARKSEPESAAFYYVTEIMLCELCLGTASCFSPNV